MFCMKHPGHWFNYGLLYLRPVMKSVPAVLWIPQLSLSYCSAVINGQQRLGSKLAQYTRADDDTSDDQEWRFSLIGQSWWTGRSPFHFGGARFKRDQEKWSLRTSPSPSLCTGMRLGSEEIITVSLKSTQNMKMVKEAQSKRTALPLCHVWPWNSRRLLCITAAEQRCQIIQQPPNTSSLHTAAAALLTQLTVPSPRPSPSTLLPR